MIAVAEPLGEQALIDEIVAKHLQGQHDQKTHGNWAGGGWVPSFTDVETSSWRVKSVTFSDKQGVTIRLDRHHAEDELQVFATGPSDEEVGGLRVNMADNLDHVAEGEVLDMSVDEGWRRRGIGTAMFRWAQTLHSKVHHSSTLTGEGRAFAEAVTKHQGPGAHPGTGTPQEAHGRKGSGGGGGSLTKPEWDPDASHEANRAAKDEWRANVRGALARGELTNEEAIELGYFGLGHDEDPRTGLNWQPLPDDLYHATTAASAVKESGLKTRAELAQERGLGLGGGESDTISFTADPAVADNIVRSLREMHDVATGKTTAADILADATAGTGADGPWVNDLVRQWDYTWEPGQPLPQGLVDLTNGYKTERAILAKTFTEWMDANPEHTWEPASDPIGTTGDHYTAFRRPLTTTERITDTADLLKTSMAWRSHHGGPPDPLFFLSDVAGLANVDPAEIQVLRFRPVEGAHGYQLGSLGEWRTVSGDLVELVDDVAKHLQGQHDQKTHGNWAGGRGGGSGDFTIHRGIWLDAQGRLDPTDRQAIAQRIKRSDTGAPRGHYWTSDEDIADEFAVGEFKMSSVWVFSDPRHPVIGVTLSGQGEPIENKSPFLLPGEDGILPPPADSPIRVKVWRMEPGKSPRKREVVDEFILDEVDAAAVIAKHQGPGAHPGTGTPQKVHGGGGGSPARGNGESVALSSGVEILYDTAVDAETATRIETRLSEHLDAHPGAARYWNLVQVHEDLTEFVLSESPEMEGNFDPHAIEGAVVMDVNMAAGGKPRLTMHLDAFALSGGQDDARAFGHTAGSNVIRDPAGIVDHEFAHVLEHTYHLDKVLTNYPEHVRSMVAFESWEDAKWRQLPRPGSIASQLSSYGASHPSEATAEAWAGLMGVYRGEVEGFGKAGLYAGAGLRTVRRGDTFEATVRNWAEDLVPAKVPMRPETYDDKDQYEAFAQYLIDMTNHATAVTKATVVVGGDDEGEGPVIWTVDPVERPEVDPADIPEEWPTPTTDLAKHQGFGFAVAKHQGPGPHPGTGTPQEAHAGAFSGGGVGTRIADLPDKYVTAMERKAEALGISVDSIRSEMDGHFQRGDPADGQWYSKAHDEISTMAEAHGIEVSQATAIVAVLSPAREWTKNLRDAETIMSVLSEDKPFEISAEILAKVKGTLRTPNKVTAGATLRPSDLDASDLASLHPAILSTANITGLANPTRAVSMFRGADIDATLGGPKVRSFYNNILHPEDSRFVTIDTWMYRAGVNPSHRMPGTANKVKGSYTLAEFYEADVRPQDIFQSSPGPLKGTGMPSGVGVYPLFAEAVHLEAARHNLTPNAYQAIVWQAMVSDAGGFDYV